MIGHGEIEDAIREALMPLHRDQGGPLQTLSTADIFTVEEAVAAAKNTPSPSCSVVASSADFSELRANGYHDAVHTVVLLISARSYKSRGAAARGGEDRAGVYDLLKQTKQALLGREVLSGHGSELRIVREWLLDTDQNLIIWAQEWKLRVYHAGVQ
ncbi:hypothetical protein SIID45300_01747 [Candidatus Magnetaquicoccaceae bacterium FCR-1]|uniref:Uncharacterized protein n=1 Tax=Candidatus Magnetaquiglobus chichijimensis TaxID=3141448 RepID=A0ABQ0C954_9PROT